MIRKRWRETGEGGGNIVAATGDGESVQWGCGVERVHCRSGAGDVGGERGVWRGLDVCGSGFDSADVDGGGGAGDDDDRTDGQSCGAVCGRAGDADGVGADAGRGSANRNISAGDGVARASFTVPNLTPGNYFLTASYAGDASDAASSGGNVPVLLYTQSAGTVTMTATLNPIVQGNTILLTANLSGNASGTVEFRVGSDVLATTTTSNGVATTTLSMEGAPLGTYAVQAYFLGGGTSCRGCRRGLRCP